MLEKDELVALIDRLRALLRNERALRWAYLFGSAVSGGRYRDVDVAVMPEPAFGLLEQAGLAERLSGALGAKVDVTDLSAATLAFAGPMLRERVILLDRMPPDRRDWEATTTSRWLDFEPAWKDFVGLRAEALRRRLAAGR